MGQRAVKKNVLHARRPNGRSEGRCLLKSGCRSNPLQSRSIPMYNAYFGNHSFSQVSGFIVKVTEVGTRGTPLSLSAPSLSIAHSSINRGREDLLGVRHRSVPRPAAGARPPIAASEQRQQQQRARPAAPPLQRHPRPRPPAWPPPPSPCGRTCGCRTSSSATSRGTPAWSSCSLSWRGTAARRRARWWCPRQTRPAACWGPRT
jgi:hypothetical protein